MTNLNKLTLILAIMLGVSISGFAGEAILFDDPGLVGYRDDGRVYGFYDARNEKFSCAFFFFQDGGGLNRPDVNGYTDTGLLTFVPGTNSFEFSDRDKTFDIKGDLYRSEDEWVIKTAAGQAGCENATGGIFSLGSMEAARYRATKEIPAIGIRIAKGKSFLYDLRGGNFIVRKGYLTKWDVVVVAETRDQFSLVRFSDPRLNAKSYGKVTTGWMHSADLVNPFPPAAKQ